MHSLTVSPARDTTNYFRYVFHNLVDEKAALILHNVIEVMKSEYFNPLTDDHVFPGARCSAGGNG